MRVLNAHIHWLTNLELRRRPAVQEVEIGLGVAIWTGLVFVVVHFGALTAT